MFKALSHLEASTGASGNNGVVDCNEKTATMEIFISEIPRALVRIP